ncbi:MAG: hypothetical protein ACSHWW_08675 [Nonlabens sp.]|uniref:hypothetical protein n=1 Tax=Nonlabens sp. TaxID=1888209 RepID=UPI003EF3A068
MNNYLKISLLIFLSAYSTSAQIGIGTFDLHSETLLDIYSENKGLLLPRMNIDNFDTYTLPVGPTTESLLSYNTNSVLGKGFTYWTGTRWSHMNNDFFWSTYGEHSINNSNFIGTTDSTPFILGTNSISRLQITTTGNFLAHNNGTMLNPSWAMTGTNIGAYSTGNNLKFSLLNEDYVSISNSNGVFLNPSQNDIDIHMNSDNGSLLQMDSNLNRIGIAATSPVESTLHIQGATSNVRIQSLSSSNSNNNGVDKSVLFVDSNGEFKLEPTPHITQLPQFEYESGYLLIPVTYSSSTLGATSSTIYTTSQELFEDGLLEVVYQTSVSVRSTFGGAITDGLPRKYGIRILVDGRVIGQTSKMYTSDASGGLIASGFMYLNGKGYVPLTGSLTGTTHNIEVQAFVDGGGNNTRIVLGSSSNDLFEVIVHY